jgi:hypothetical protein
MDGFSKNVQKQNVTKLRPVDADRHMDGRTDMIKLIIAFRNTANAPKNQSVNAVCGNNRCLF